MTLPKRGCPPPRTKVKTQGESSSRAVLQLRVGRGREEPGRDCLPGSLQREHQGWRTRLNGQHRGEHRGSPSHIGICKQREAGSDSHPSHGAELLKPHSAFCLRGICLKNLSFHSSSEQWCSSTLLCSYRCHNSHSSTRNRGYNQGITYTHRGLHPPPLQSNCIPCITITLHIPLPWTRLYPLNKTVLQQQLQNTSACPHSYESPFLNRGGNRVSMDQVSPILEWLLQLGYLLW